MHNITLICTKHIEIGNCNSKELHRIIEEINPEVIFEELSQTAYKECYGIKNRTTVETSAIKMYLRNHDLEHIPVVDSELSDDLYSKIEFMCKHDSYRKLMDTLLLSEGKFGFQFLNSEYCDELFEEMKTAEKLILEDKDDEILVRINQRSNENIDNYENGIIKNVYRYSEENTYNTAIMFIGAAHRKSIMQKIQEYQMKQKIKLNWILYNNQF